MEWEKLIQKFLKNLDNLIPFLFFAVMILGPIIKAAIQKKKERQAGGRPAGPEPEKDEAPSWWEEETEQETAPEKEAVEELPPPPPTPRPVVRPIPEPEPAAAPQPVPAMAMESADTPIERASDDVVEEAARLAMAAESVSALSREEKLAPATVSMEAYARPVAPAVAESPLHRLSPLEAAIVFGNALDRPVAFSEPTWGRF